MALFDVSTDRIRFRELDYPDRLVTRRIEVLDCLRDEAELGTIAWDPGRMRYVFVPSSAAPWDINDALDGEQLKQIASTLAYFTVQWREQRGGPRPVPA